MTKLVGALVAGPVLIATMLVGVMTTRPHAMRITVVVQVDTAHVTVAWSAPVVRPERVSGYHVRLGDSAGAWEQVVTTTALTVEFAIPLLDDAEQTIRACVRALSMRGRPGPEACSDPVVLPAGDPLPGAPGTPQVQPRVTGALLPHADSLSYWPRGWTFTALADVVDLHLIVWYSHPTYGSVPTSCMVLPDGRRGWAIVDLLEPSGIQLAAGIERDDFLRDDACSIEWVEVSDPDDAVGLVPLTVQVLRPAAEAE